MSAHQPTAEASAPVSAEAVQDFIAEQFLGGSEAPPDEEDETQIPEGELPEGTDPDDPDFVDPDNPDDPDGEAPPEPIPAPISWDKDAKELFAQLSPDLQAKVVEREAQRDRAIQTATTEAANAKRNATAEAHQQLAQFQRHYASELEQIAVRLAPQRPDPTLAATNPTA